MISDQQPRRADLLGNAAQFGKLAERHIRLSPEGDPLIAVASLHRSSLALTAPARFRVVAAPAVAGRLLLLCRTLPKEQPTLSA